MSVSVAEGRVRACQRELERQRSKQAEEDRRAARFEKEALRYEEQAGRSSSASLVASKLRAAHAKRADAARAREAAARASAAVASSQRKLHDAQAALAKEAQRERARVSQRSKREQERADRVRAGEERRLRERERAHDQELARLRQSSATLEARVDALPWAHSPEAITVLFVAAMPDDQLPLRIDREAREVQQRVRESDYRDAVQFEHRLATQVTDLLQALNETRPHVVHFSGHGAQEALIFENDDGNTRPLTNDELARLLHIASDRIRLAVFNSCDSAEQAALACEHIDAAIGMNAPISDEAAKVFSGQLYNAIGFGKPLQLAFDQAVLQTQLALGGTSGDPRLHLAPDVDPDELYLVRPPQ